MNALLLPAHPNKQGAGRKRWEGSDAANVVTVSLIVVVHVAVVEVDVHGVVLVTRVRIGSRGPEVASRPGRRGP